MMEKTVKDRREKWVIIPLDIEEGRVTTFDHKLPANVFHCTGVMVSISGLSGFYIRTRLGELSLSFNNRAAQPVNLPGNWIPYRTRLDQVLYKLEEPLAGGTRVTGYFKNIVEFPYKVQIYLQCLSEITISQT
jgi:hypothetical protein